MSGSNLISPRAHQVIVHTSANKLETLAGATIGLFNNSKPNAALLLDLIAERIDQRVGLKEVIRMSKPSPAEAAADLSYDTLAARCDAVIFGTADCGSCTAWGIHDVAAFEQRGLPTVCLTGHPFLPLAEAYSKSLGYSTAPIVFRHPIAGREEAYVEETADAVLDDVMNAFLVHDAAAVAA